jgi:hypothetical protein
MKKNSFIIGIAIGIAVGTALHNIAMGIALGAGIALAMGGNTSCTKNKLKLGK